MLLGSHKSSLTSKKRKLGDCSPVQAAEAEASVRRRQKFSHEDKREIHSLVTKSSKSNLNQFDWTHIRKEFNERRSRNCTNEHLRNCYNTSIKAKANLYGLCLSFLFFLFFIKNIILKIKIIILHNYQLN